MEKKMGHSILQKLSNSKDLVVLEQLRFIRWIKPLKFGLMVFKNLIKRL